VAVSLIQTSIGKKMIMGICGAIWAGFVLGHMAGNMLILVSAEAYNKYGHAIVSNKPLLYTAEVILVLSLVIHATLGIKLYLENRRANAGKYAVPASPQKRARFASRTMAFHGTMILIFIIYHLITFKYGPHYNVTYDGVEIRDLHRLIVEVFQSPAYIAWYVVCLVLLAFHLSHGVSSVFQTLGANHPKYNCMIRKLSIGYSIFVVAGFLSQPLYVFFLL